MTMCSPVCPDVHASWLCPSLAPPAGSPPAPSWAMGSSRLLKAVSEELDVLLKALMKADSEVVVAKSEVESVGGVVVLKTKGDVLMSEAVGGVTVLKAEVVLSKVADEVNKAEVVLSSAEIVLSEAEVVNCEAGVVLSEVDFLEGEVLVEALHLWWRRLLRVLYVLSQVVQGRLIPSMCFASMCSLILRVWPSAPHTVHTLVATLLLPYTMLLSPFFIRELICPSSSCRLPVKPNLCWRRAMVPGPSSAQV